MLTSQRMMRPMFWSLNTAAVLWGLPPWKNHPLCCSFDQAFRIYVVKCRNRMGFWNSCNPSFSYQHSCFLMPFLVSLLKCFPSQMRYLNIPKYHLCLEDYIDLLPS